MEKFDRKKMDYKSKIFISDIYYLLRYYIKTFDIFCTFRDVILNTTYIDINSIVFILDNHHIANILEHSIDIEAIIAIKSLTTRHLTLRLLLCE